MSGQANYSPITWLSKTENQVSFGHKEIEPKPVVKKESLSNLSEQEALPKAETSRQSEPTLEVIPDLPEIDEGLQNVGVEVIDNDSIFVANGRKIDLPMSIATVDKGLHKPLTSGWRWIAELTRYILAKFGIKIKKHGQKYKLVEQH